MSSLFEASKSQKVIGREREFGRVYTSDPSSDLFIVLAHERKSKLQQRLSNKDTDSEGPVVFTEVKAATKEASRRQVRPVRVQTVTHSEPPPAPAYIPPPSKGTQTGGNSKKKKKQQQESPVGGGGQGWRQQ